uniref:Uncharacterized protein n=1 Tax=Triticum urartu TaxID=4572 RepID=A0A8R7QNG0_TRIUA
MTAPDLASTRCPRPCLTSSWGPYSSGSSSSSPRLRPAASAPSARATTRRTARLPSSPCPPSTSPPALATSAPTPTTSSARRPSSWATRLGRCPAATCTTRTASCRGSHCVTHVSCAGTSCPQMWHGLLRAATPGLRLAVRRRRWLGLPFGGSLVEALLSGGSLVAGGPTRGSSPPSCLH